jgi:hypothetical protein
MNVALPSIRHDLGFSAQDLQWVLSGYLVTYGGLLLLGGRAGLLNTSQRLGTALGLAAIATARASALLAAYAPSDAALTAGFHRALLACGLPARRRRHRDARRQQPRRARHPPRRHPCRPRAGTVPTACTRIAACRVTAIGSRTPDARAAAQP